MTITLEQLKRWQAHKPARLHGGAKASRAIQHFRVIDFPSYGLRAVPVKRAAAWLKAAGVNACEFDGEKLTANLWPLSRVSFRVFTEQVPALEFSGSAFRYHPSGPRYGDTVTIDAMEVTPYE